MERARGEPTLLAALALRGEVLCAAARGTWLAAGGGDGALRLWRWRAVAGWEAAGEVRAHRYGVTCAAWARSGALLCSAGVDGAARVWAASALAERRALLAPGAAAARALQWAADERVVVGHDDGALRVWALRGGVLLAHVRAHDGALHAVAALARAALLLTACTDGVLKVFDFEELVRAGGGAEVHAGPVPLLWEDGAHDLGALCACGWARGAATGGRDALVREWRVAGAGRARRLLACGALAGHTDAVTALSRARGVLASASLDRTARLWARGRCVRVLLAHPRYLTCVQLDAELRYMVTGSQDASLRTWALGALSLADELAPACAPHEHFGLGDLEGIGPVDEQAAPEPARGAAAAGARCVARAPHPAAVNCVAARGELLATASSDGRVRVFRWRRAAQGEGELRALHELSAHAYPALAVDFSASGAALLSAGLDGCARLWDVESGAPLAALSAAGLRGGGGGGGVRDARLSPHGTLLLLASDDALAAVWSADPVRPDPLHVYFERLSDAATCCAWSRDARAAACGGAAGELLLLAAPPEPAMLAACSDAHDLGVLSCDFSPGAELLGEAEESGAYLLASGGRDARIKLWRAAVTERGLRELCAWEAHEGAVQCVRWGGAGALCSGGADRWARVWRVRRAGGELLASALAAVPVAAGGAPAVCPLADGHVAVGALAGSLALWRLPEDATPDDGDGAEPRAWGTPGVIRWIREYVTRAPGCAAAAEAEARLERCARGAALSGARLLDDSLRELLHAFGYGSEDDETSSETDADATLERLRDEILWLRRDSLSDELEQSAPHTLRCALSHDVLREPVRAADGYTYERQSFLHWMIASGDDASELRSPVTGRRLHSAAVAPNYGVRDMLRRFLAWPQPQPQPQPQLTSDDERDQ